MEALVLLGTYTDHRLLLRVSHNFALRSMGRLLAAGTMRFTSQPLRARGQRLRLGYISGGLREHPDGKNLQGVFERHDRTRLEVMCFSLKRDEGTAVQKRLQAGCERWFDYTELSNEAAARGVNSAGVHVLLDVNGLDNAQRFPKISGLRLRCIGRVMNHVALWPLMICVQVHGRGCSVAAQHYPRSHARASADQLFGVGRFVRRAIHAVCSTFPRILEISEQ